MKLPEHKNKLLEELEKHQEESQDLPRLHLGCSLIGDKCERAIWLSFRWSVIEKFEARKLRIFRRGQNEEYTVVSDLRSVGLDVRNTGTAQSKVDFGCHVSGSLDGLVFGGYHEAPKSKSILEIKTHSQKSFDDLVKNGVEKSKFKHFIQCQAYMKGTNTDRALYYAVNKNDDSIYVEWIHFDEKLADQYIGRAKRIALSERMPEPLSTRDDWYECKYCAGHDICFGSKLTKEVNCRTCAHSTPTEDSHWLCARYGNAEIPGEAQRNGCECHVLHPDMTPYKRLEGTEWTAVYEIDGHRVENGEPCANVYSSKEIVANAHGCANSDSFVRELRKDGARIVELTLEDIPF